MRKEESDSSQNSKGGKRTSRSMYNLAQYGSISNNVPKMIRGNLDNPVDAG